MSNEPYWAAVGDLHLTDKPQDAYRLQVFEWLAAEPRDQCRGVLILGDLVHTNDKLSNRLWDDLLTAMRIMVAAFGKVVLIDGNHDYRDAASSVGRVLESLEGVVRPTRENPVMMLAPLGKCGFYHHDHKFEFPNTTGLSWAFFHQHFAGASRPGGQAIPGGSALPDRWPSGCKYLAGDIHDPQKVGAIQYVGSPQPTTFAETHEPGFWRVYADRAEFVPKAEGVRFHTVDLGSPDELEAVKAMDARPRDRFRLRIDPVKCGGSRGFEEFRSAVQDWAGGTQMVVKVEKVDPQTPMFTEEGQATPQARADDPASLVAEYAREQGLSPTFEEAGRELVGGD